MDVVTTEAAVDAITDAVAAVTMAAIMAVITEVADGVFPVEITPAAIFCGSSSFCVCVATTAGDVAMAAATVTAAGSSLFCSCCAATMAVAAAADSRFRFFAEQGIFSPAFCRCFICYLRHFRLLFSSRFLTFSFCFLFSCRSFGLQ